MQFHCLTVIAATLFVGVNACKCVNGGRNDQFTRECCASLGGNFVNGNDCQAGSISEKLSNFRSCCRGKGQGFTSDCDCPTCRSGSLEEDDQSAAVK
jgi:hypothetical protein